MPSSMDWVAVDKCMLSRLLYPNPVCLLSVLSSDGNDRSLMTITWITAINNQGGFICSMNATRYTANFMNQSGAVFVLNVPVRGMEELVLAIGSSSGSDGDKFEQLNIPICAPGGEDFQNVAKDTHETEAHQKKQKLSRKELARQEIASAAAQSVALRDCVAHLLCRVDTVTEDDGHLLLRCTQLAGWSRRAYWDGRNFLPQEGTNVEPYLTFLGSKMFGYVQSASSVTASKGSTDA
ncbi:Flavin reductase like domain [Phytophthora infestans]|uniref:Flavin reductase like domain n=1 Tax=Phytophthora infestans TaxID=4787 RepID=A0A833T6N7_PHYIN|nr:Flavin reductase like domain [Phytophthora infestans]KAF4146044.1 Flavin reductase like domain [Phytophthora infestans]